VSENVVAGNQVAGILYFDSGSSRNTISNNEVDGVGDGYNTGNLNVKGAFGNVVSGNHAVRLLSCRHHVPFAHVRHVAPAHFRRSAAALNTGGLHVRRV
jgi:parallel beta-helix repeat protein